MAVFKRKSMNALRFGGLVVLLCGIASAAPVAAGDLVFSCPTGCNGNTYAIYAQPDSEGSTSYYLGVVIDTTGYTGGDSGYLAALQVKNFAPTYSGFIGPDSYVDQGSGWVLGDPANWDTLSSNELNANGCAGGSGSGRQCVEGPGYQFSKGEMLQFVFTLVAPDGFNSTSHLKYLFTDENWDKVGSLGSFDIAIQILDPPCPDCYAPPPPEVPEPGTWALMGAGLGVLGVVARKRRDS